MSHSAHELTDLRIGQCLILSRVPTPKGAKARWVCQCDCGTIFSAFQHFIQRRPTLMCQQCAWRLTALKNSTRGGEACRIEYNVWKKMLSRCSNPQDKAYKYYGARGITVCERWKTFDNFLKDMGHRPQPGLSIERIANYDNYTPENCIWATRTQQNRNKRSNHLITMNGKTKCLAEWCELIGRPFQLANKRINTKKWDDVRAITTPPRKYSKRISEC
jgi:hypothetical protein